VPASPPTQNVQTVQDAKIKGISVWFYIIAAFQLVAAFMTWSSGSADAGLAAAAMGLAAVDIGIGLLFVVFGYYAGKKQPWAFVAGLILYALRAVVQFFQFFSPVSLLIRAFLMFRIWQGLQACLAANRATQAVTLVQQRRLVMPQTSPAMAEPVIPPPAWTPARGPVASPSNAE